MAQQFVNTGTTANDGTGDTLRIAAQKINQNFTEVYNLLGSTVQQSADWNETTCFTKKRGYCNCCRNWVSCKDI